MKVRSHSTWAFKPIRKNREKANEKMGTLIPSKGESEGLKGLTLNMKLKKLLKGGMYSKMVIPVFNIERGKATYRLLAIEAKANFRNRVVPHWKIVTKSVQGT
jgi:hypothetical protein